MFQELYDKNHHLSSVNLVGKVKNLMAAPNWIGDEDRFWIKLDSSLGHEFLIVDAASGEREPAFDHAAIAQALAGLGMSDLKPEALPLTDLIIDGERRTLMLGDKRFDCMADGSDARPAQATAVGWEQPGGERVAYLHDHNLWIRDAAGGNARALTEDGEALYAYGDMAFFDNMQVPRRRAGLPATPSAVHWSPDGRYLLALRMDRRDLPLRTHICEFAAPDKKYMHSILQHFGVAGDHRMPRLVLSVIDVESGRVTPVDLDARQLGDFAMVHFATGQIWWQPGKLIMETANWRGHRYGVAEVDLATGQARQIIEETEQHYYAFNPNDYNAPNIQLTADGQEVIWYSQRSGYGHLYLYDASSGALKRPLTQGDWLVCDLLHVDDESRMAWFTGTGREAGRNPYYRHLYRVSLDGGEPELLTPEDADHQFDNMKLPGMPAMSLAVMSPSGKYFVDAWSTVSNPPVAVIRRADGTQVSGLYEADDSALRALEGWREPEPFTTLAADGTTELYGLMFKPADFETGRKYPVIDCTYPGPQGKFTPTTYMDGIRSASIRDGQMTANLGFVVLAFDGRGCSGRSREFRYAFAGTEDVFGSVDHVAGVRHLAQHLDFIDVERVGITGGSFGGYGSSRAQLLNGDFYKVCVASVGPNDYRQMALSISNDRFFRVSDDMQEAEEFYELTSNTRLAGRLQGRLLLIYGEVDENVPLNQSFLMFEALQNADKDYDTLMLTNQPHGGPAGPYATRQTLRYFYEHL